MYNPPNQELDIDVMKDAASLNRKTLLIGDLNAKHTVLNSNRNNDSGKQLVNLLMNSNISIVNNDEPTHVPYDGTPDRLDLALSTSNLVPQIRDFTVCDMDAIHGHAPILVSITMESI